MNTQNTKTSFGAIMKYTGFAIISSIIINTILFYVGKAAGAFPETVLLPNQNTPLTIVPVIFSSTVPSLVAGLVMGLINRFAKNPKKIFMIISVILLVFSFVNPFMIPNVTLAMAVTLNLMHVVVAGNLMYFYNKNLK
jgi:hypothetical protein